MNNIELQKKR